MDCTSTSNEALNSDTNILIASASSILLICARYRENDILDKFNLKGEKHIKTVPYDVTQVVGYFEVAIIDGGTSLVKGDTVYRRVLPYLKSNVGTFIIYENE